MGYWVLDNAQVNMAPVKTVRHVAWLSFTLFKIPAKDIDFSA